MIAIISSWLGMSLSILLGEGILGVVAIMAFTLLALYFIGVWHSAELQIRKSEMGYRKWWMG